MPSLLSYLLMTARRDTWVKIALCLFFAVGIALQASSSIDLQATSSAVAGILKKLPAIGEITLLGLILVSLVRGIGDIVRIEERSFWRRLILAYSCWFIGAALLLFPDPIGLLPRRALQVVFYAAFYIFLIRALETEPHRSRSRRKSRLDRLLTWPAVTFFVLGLVIYFVFIPAVLNWEELLKRGVETASDRRDEFYLYTLLDFYLSFRLLVLSRRATLPRWRVLYRALALPWIVFVVLVDISFIANQNSFFWPFERIPDWWQHLPYAIQVLVIRLRHHIPNKGEMSTKSKAGVVLDEEELSFVVSGRTLMLGVTFPMLHIIVSRFGWIEEPGHEARQILMLVWLGFFGAISLVQHRQLERRAQRLWLDRVTFEEDLRASEQDLRLIIEKNRATEVLEAAERKLDFTFRACPYTLVITRLEDGRFLEVNPAFEETFGYRRDEVLGRSFEEVGLFIDPADVADLGRRIESQEDLQEAEFTFKTKSGAERLAVVSTAVIELEGEPCLLSIVYDITDSRRQEESLEAGRRLLEQTEAAIFEIDDQDRISSWNRGASLLSGWSAETVIGRPAAEFLQPYAEIEEALAGASPEWAGRLVLVAGESEGIRLDAWCTRMRSPLESKLVIAAPTSAQRA